MGVLQSPVFTMCDPQTRSTLENCATGTPNEFVSHFAVGGANARGEHIRCVQQALMNVRSNHPSLGIPEIKVDGVYGPNSAKAILAYKRAREVRNHAGQVDNIVGTGTMRALDSDNCWNVPDGPTAPAPKPEPKQPAPPSPDPNTDWNRPLPMPPYNPNPGGPPPGAGLKLLQGGIWTGGGSVGVKGGQAMVFELTNTNPMMGTTITVRSDRDGIRSLILPPGVPMKMEFSSFGKQPMGWSFNVTTDSDVCLIGWKLLSSWVEGDPAD